MKGIERSACAIATIAALLSGCAGYEVHEHEAARSRAEEAVVQCKLDPVCKARSDENSGFQGQMGNR